MLHQTKIRKILVNGDQWASWEGYHVPVGEHYFVVWTPIGTTMHWRPGDWTAYKHQLSFFYPNEWYTIHVGYNAQGEFQSGYCDIVLPTAEYSNTDTEMIYVDLYVDVVVDEDYSVYTKDQEAYSWAEGRYPIVQQSHVQAYEALDWMEEQAKAWSGPFLQIPRSLPRTDFEQLSPEAAAEILRSLTKANEEGDKRK